MAKQNKQNEKTLLTDLYQLTMNAAYFDNNKDETATFELFIRKLPKDWGYFIANGIEDAVDYATNIKFQDEDIDYLKNQRLFKQDFLESLKNFKFEGDIYAVKEGTPITENTPILRVTAKRSQAQFLETTLLNIINYQTMIATKANRIVNAAQGAKVVDFGLRRAHGEDASMKGARASYIAGAAATSNIKAGKEYGIPISGTQAHSFVMSFPNELDAFRAYVKTFSNNPILLIDTYDTLQGARNAAVVAKEIEREGKKLGGVRLDSEPLLNLSKNVRKILDERNLDYVKIVASNDLNEYTIDDLIRRGANIDAYGVGTEMITAKPVAAIPGVYKLVEDKDGAKIKLAYGKKTYPGKKQVYRVLDENGKYSYDILALENEKVDGQPLLELIVKDGERVYERKSLEETRKYCLDSITKLPDKYKQVKVNSPYTFKVSKKLEELVDNLTRRYISGGNQNENNILECGYSK
ncbi:MAG TPA: nicotinate phosphoribosyltransferase [Candidatus Nanoarchaeia archaeon]|nr:nicotinate phosphoribosyltransferase [Candidatus Nanoarchaeia archaeon]